MGAQGQVEVDFGAHPGAIEKEVDVVTSGVVATSLVEAWLFPDATTDHNADEHIAMMDSLRVQGRYKVDGTITIRVQPIFPQHDHTRGRINRRTLEAGGYHVGAERQRASGKWVVAWCWN